MGLISYLKSIFPRSGQSILYMQDRPVTKLRTKSAIIDAYEGLVYGCIQENAAGCSNGTFRLYAVGGGETQAAARRRFGGKPVSGKSYDWIRTAAPANLKAIDRGDLTELTTHPVLDLLKMPNPEFPAHEMMQQTFAFWDLLGNAYWKMDLVPIGGRLQPVALWPLASQFVDVKQDRQGNLIGYKYGNHDTGFEEYLPEEVVHFRYFNPKNLYVGMGPLEAALSGVRRITYMNQWEESLWQNQCRPDFVVENPNATTKQQREEMRTDFASRFSGKNAGRPVILPSGITIKPFSHPPKDINHLAFAKFTREEIASIFDVPMPLIEMSVSNKASAAEAKETHLRQAVLPRLLLMQSFLNHKLLPLYDPNLVFIVDNPIPEDKDQRLKENAEKIKAGVLLPNEWRMEEGLEPHEWGNVPLPLWNSQYSTGNPASDSQPDDSAGQNGKSYYKGLNARESAMKQGFNGITERQAKAIVDHANSWF